MTNKVNRQKHADLIIAWANGAKIQFLDRNLNKWKDVDSPFWDLSTSYRIKPEPLPTLIKSISANFEPNAGMMEITLRVYGEHENLLKFYKKMEDKLEFRSDVNE